jgi:hypothetical protein
MAQLMHDSVQSAAAAYIAAMPMAPNVLRCGRARHRVGPKKPVRTLIRTNGFKLNPQLSPHFQ